MDNIKDTSVKPYVVVIAGPNGAGKTTCATHLLPKNIAIKHFVNADLIAKGLSPFDPSVTDIEAGRLMLKRIKTLTKKKENFAFETTLASKLFVNLLENCRADGFQIVIIFLSLVSPELAFSRVKTRVERGGHFVPEETVRRRYRRGIVNFFTIYKDLADIWILGDNSHSSPTMIAYKVKEETFIVDRLRYDSIIQNICSNE